MQLNRIYHEDCLVGLKQITTESIDLVVTDCPYKIEAGLQFSINSTDEEQRNRLFNSRSISLEEIARLADALPMPKGRKYTLNFPVTKDTILDAKELNRLFDKDKFIVKITPIHETREAVKNGIKTDTGYYSYDVYEQFEQPLLKEGWEVIVFIPSREEDEDRITCGNALMSSLKTSDMEWKNGETKTDELLIKEWYECQERGLYCDKSHNTRH